MSVGVEESRMRVDRRGPQDRVSPRVPWPYNPVRVVPARPRDGLRLWVWVRVVEAPDRRIGTHGRRWSPGPLYPHGYPRTPVKDSTSLLRKIYRRTLGVHLPHTLGVHLPHPT